jgi:phospholipase D1/2
MNQATTANASYQPYQGQQQEQKPYYAPPPNQGSGSPAPHQGQNQSQAPYYPPPPGQEPSHSNTRGIDDHPYASRNQYEGDRERGSLAPRRFKEDLTQYGNSLRGQLAGQIHQYQDRLTTYGRPSSSQGRGNMSCQIVRSCAKWSNGTPVEHSIADAYCAIIRNSEHFIYIENQFFITATGDSQHPVKNQIGAAIVERILRAARAGQKYKIVVVIPSVPCFAGDLRDDETLGTRAIMEFQYNSINRGGHSIMELIAKEGFNPMEYIRFYNLRNYDRINNGSMVAAAELQSGVNYEDASRQYDQHTAGPGGYAPNTARSAFDTTAPFQKYQQGAQQVQGSHASSSRWDSVSECYMLGGEDIRRVPWNGHPDAEIDAFVSEELYVHSKVCPTRISRQVRISLKKKSKLTEL